MGNCSSNCCGKFKILSNSFLSFWNVSRTHAPTIGVYSISNLLKFAKWYYFFLGRIGVYSFYLLGFRIFQ
ncbi:hypothetical protein CW304_24790 [Bacillus sp. UFRGS-B20]|nr:hypothetical protein CW304_24790 [Bacillus sp. UFRGS-B20]